MSSPWRRRASQYPNGIEPRRYPPRIAAASVRGMVASDRNSVGPHPRVHDAPVEVPEEGVDVGRAVRLVVEEVRVLVDVERDERRRVPDRERVLGVPYVVEETPLVPVIG